LGIPSELITGKQQPCPMCGGTDRFQFSDRSGDGDFICRQCGAGKGLQLLVRFYGWDFRRAAEEVDRTIGNLPVQAQQPPEFYTTRAANPAALRRLWKSSVRLNADDACGRYLTERGLASFFVKPSVVRYVSSLKHYAQQTHHPGMIALFSFADGSPATIHRTYLDFGGRKAAVTPNRMFMPGKVSAGGAIRLGDEAETMGVAEGIETAMSASLLFNMPVWATTSEGFLQKWQPPPIAKSIAIFADADANFVGQHAAYALAKRLSFEAVRDKIERAHAVMVPEKLGDDWNDVLMQRKQTGAAA
jgi:putative DNA primase/helicase